MVYRVALHRVAACSDAARAQHGRITTFQARHTTCQLLLSTQVDATLRFNAHSLLSYSAYASDFFIVFLVSSLLFPTF